MDGDSLGMVEALLAGGGNESLPPTCPCGKPTAFKGLCFYHYGRMRRAARLGREWEGAAPQRRGKKPSVLGPCPCGKPAKIKGLCLQHYGVARRGRPVAFIPVRSSRDTLRERHRAKHASVKPSLRLNLLTRRNTAAELRHWREWWASPESGRDPMPHPEEECAEAPCGWLTARMPGNDWREVYEDEVHRHANRPRSSWWSGNHDWHGIADLDGSGWTFWPRDDGERGW